MKYILIALFFLSSGVAGADNDHLKGPCGKLDCNPFSGVRSIDIVLEKEDWPNEIVEPVPFAALNISEQLNGWHDIFDLQIMLAKRQAIYDVLLPSKLNDDWWSLLPPLGQASILLGLLLLVSGVLYWSDNALHKQLQIGKE